MKKLIYFLLLLPFFGLAQVQTGGEFPCDYGLWVNPTFLQTVTTPTYIGIFGTDGTCGKIPSAYIEKTANKVNTMTSAGADDLTNYPTVRAANTQLNNVARTLANIGLADVGSDTFAMARQDDTHLNVTGTSIGVIFPVNFETVIPYPGGAVKQIPTNTSYPLQNFLSYLPTSSTQAVFYIGWRDTTQNFELSTASYAQNPDVFQCGIIFLKNVAGTISFIDATRTVYAIPDVSQYSNLETTAIGVKSNVFMSPNTGSMTVKNSAGSVVGLSVCYKCANNDEKVIAANATTTFRRLNPGNANATVLPATTTTVTTTDYWNGSAMTTLAANGNASVQRFMVTVLGTVILQVGEASYSNFQDAKDNAYTATFTDLIPKGTFVEINRLVAVKNCSDLGNNGQAVFTSSGGGGGGGSVGASLQVAYNGSTAPQITTSTTLGAFELKRGSAADTDKVFKVSNGAGTETMGIVGSGNTTVITNTTTVSLDGQNSGTGTAIRGISQAGNSGQFLNTSSANATLYAQNLSTGKILSLNNLGTGEVASVDNSGNLTANSFIKSGATTTDALLAGGGTLVNPMDLGSAQTITGVKTFNDGKLGHRNVANTFTSFFTNAATASRTYTLPDKSGTVAMTSDITSTLSGTANSLIKFTGTTTGGNSILADDNIHLGVGSVSPIALSKDIQLGRQGNKEIGIEQSDSSTPGKDLVVSAGRTINFQETSNFIDLLQASRAYQKGAAAANKDVFISSGSTMYKQTGGTGNFSSYYTHGSIIYSTAIDSSNNLFIATATGLFKQTNSTGSFVIESGVTIRNYNSMSFDTSGNLFAVVGNILNPNTDDYVYKRTSNTGDFATYSASVGKYIDVACAPNGDIYVSNYSTGLLKQTGGTGAFTSVSSNGNGGVCVLSNGVIYASNVIGGILPQFIKSVNNGSSFSTSTETIPYNYSKFISSGTSVYTFSQNGGSIWFQNNDALGAADLNGGALKLKAGTGKAAGQSRVQIIVGAKTTTGTAMQTETVAVQVDETLKTTFFGVVNLKGYTVSTLPTGAIGDTAYVTDALAPTFLTTVVGGGSVKCPVFFDGTNWVAH